MKKRKKAFTLSEVLIALAIIGVIAAITVPVVMVNTQKQEIVTRFKQTYSILSQAVNQIIAEEGSPKCNDGGWFCSGEDLYARLKKRLSLAKDCGKPSSECFPGDWETDASVSWADQHGSSFIMANGASFFVYDQIASKDCNSTWGTKPGEDFHICANFLIDINGPKGPNLSGNDIYYLGVSENGLFAFPGAGDDSYCLKGIARRKESDWWRSQPGTYCPAYIFKHGKIDYRLPH